nr:Gp49 family protein [uncultured Carboxylicivirga sp.]
MDKNTVLLTEAVIDAEIAKIEYQRMGKKMMICLITTHNGHEIIGESGIIDHRDFKEDIGKVWALGDAKRKLCKLLAYEAQTNLHNLFNEPEN